jgi:hypothetical protein
MKNESSLADQLLAEIRRLAFAGEHHGAVWPRALPGEIKYSEII